jgi:hypothetical protein
MWFAEITGGVGFRLGDGVVNNGLFGGFRGRQILGHDLGFVGGGPWHTGAATATSTTATAWARARSGAAASCRQVQI